MNPFSILSKSTRKRRRDLAKEVAFEMQTVQNAQTLQLQKLNTLWAHACSEISYYQNLVANGLPHNFESLEAFASQVPPFTKADCQALGHRAFTKKPKQLKWSATGGSTGEPMSFPRLSSELAIHEGSEWYLRSLVGITPDDAYFKIWGHQHLQANGAKRFISHCSRKIKDKVLGLIRISAYNLSPEAVLQGIRELQRSNSIYILGYSKALEIYAEELLRHNATKTLPTLKGVIATSEGFSTSESRKQVEEAFDCPVLMEYGSMETGPIAQEVTKGLYQVAWNNYFLEAVPCHDGTHRLLVTALYPRAFPLFRYDLGDLVSGFDRAIGIRRFGSIDGKSYPLLMTPQGNRVHPALIINCLKDFDDISFFQVGLQGDRIARIYLSLHANIQQQVVFKKLRDRLSSIDSGLSAIPFKAISQHLLTPAGKRPTFLQEKPTVSPPSSSN